MYVFRGVLFDICQVFHGHLLVVREVGLKHGTVVLDRGLERTKTHSTDEQKPLVW